MSVRVLDGGMGRELLRIGAPFRQPEWSALALLEGPDWVVRAHRNFIDAGARIITTNSYAVVPFHLGDVRFAEQGQTLAELSGRLARRAVDESAGDVTVGDLTVVGSLPPLFGSYEPDRFDADTAASIIDPLVAGLADHVDGWLAETLSSIVEATTVRAALDRSGGRATDLPLWISYTLHDDANGCLRSGETVADGVRAAIDLGASAVLFNCSQAASISRAIELTAELVDGTAVETGGYANRFVAHHADDSLANTGLSAMRVDLGPDEYAEIVDGWLTAGATIVGGCCGMEPDHIARLAALARR